MTRIENTEKTDRNVSPTQCFWIAEVSFAVVIIIGFLAGMQLFDIQIQEIVIPMAVTVLMGGLYVYIIKDQLSKYIIPIIVLHVLGIAILIGGFQLPAVIRPVCGVILIIAVMLGEKAGLYSLLLYGTSTVLFGLDPIECLLLYIIFGFIACLTAKFMSNIKKAFVLGLVLIPFYIMIHLALTYYSYYQIIQNDLQNSLIGAAAVTILFFCSTPYLFRKSAEQKGMQVENSDREKIQMKEEHTIRGILKKDTDDKKIEKEQKSKQESKPKRDILETITEPDYPPLLELKERIGTTYKHSLIVGEISYQAAKEIGGNALLAKAGGLYHDIGQGLNGEYIKEGIKICKKYKIPSDVQKIVKEHNVDYSLPSSKEAAIVMLSDSILSTIEFNRKKEPGKDLDVEKVVAMVFKIREEGDVFKKINFSPSELEILQKVYLRILGR